MVLNSNNNVSFKAIAFNITKLNGVNQYCFNPDNCNMEVVKTPYGFNYKIDNEKRQFVKDIEINSIRDNSCVTYKDNYESQNTKPLEIHYVQKRGRVVVEGNLKESQESSIGGVKIGSISPSGEVIINNAIAKITSICSGIFGSSAQSGKLVVEGNGSVSVHSNEGIITDNPEKPGKTLIDVNSNFGEIIQRNIDSDITIKEGKAAKFKAKL